jgi:hypothetical protein
MTDEELQELVDVLMGCAKPNSDPNSDPDGLDMVPAGELAGRKGLMRYAP